VRPETRYARSGDVSIAYQVLGDGPLDLVCVWGWFSHVELYWENPLSAWFFERLASFSRLILLDKRGTGASDRVPVHELPSLEQRMDDLRAVMDAVGSERAALLGVSEGGPMCTLFAATYPERTVALVLYGSFPRWLPDEGYAGGVTPEAVAMMESMFAEWGRGHFGLDLWAPSVADNPVVQEGYARVQRLSASPGAARALLQMNSEIDVRHVLPAITVPTLIVHRIDERIVPVSAARYMAERIPGAKLVLLPGVDHLPFVGDKSEQILDAIEEFLTGTLQEHRGDRVLATVLFGDLVGSTDLAARLGDARWRELLGSYYAAVRREIGRFRGLEVQTAGDGFFATFDGPARAVRCACAVRDAAAGFGLAIRAGLHTGECELMGDDVGGIAVHIGARVMAEAGGGEVLVSNTVKDLVAGSGLRFAERGARALKGVPGEWRLFAVA
jgi:pimeloyl-ACP methyl ester carboxylesterase/class 3 adenylate cyclase